MHGNVQSASAAFFATAGVKADLAILFVGAMRYW